MNAFFQALVVLLVPLVLGGTIVRLSGIAVTSRDAGWLGFSLPLGLGVSACAAFISLVVADRILFGPELALALALGVALRWRGAVTIESNSAERDPASPATRVLQGAL